MLDIKDLTVMVGGKKLSGIIARKLGDCKECKFYKRVVVSKDL
ncbi:MAG: hypothetical protein ABFR82_06365 [Nitrospirota bacterium]